MPFILRGVTLAGIDSVMRPLADRVEAWDKLAELLDATTFDDVANEISLEDAVNILLNKANGRSQRFGLISLNHLGEFFVGGTRTITVLYAHFDGQSLVTFGND